MELIEHIRAVIPVSYHLRIAILCFLAAYLQTAVYSQDLKGVPSELVDTEILMLKPSKSIMTKSKSTVPLVPKHVEPKLEPLKPHLPKVRTQAVKIEKKPALVKVPLNKETPHLIPKVTVADAEKTKTVQSKITTRKPSLKPASAKPATTKIEINVLTNPVTVSKYAESSLKIFKPAQQQAYSDELRLLAKNAAILVENGGWEGSSLQLKFGHVLHGLDPNVFTLNKVAFASLKSKLQEDNLIEVPDALKHVVLSPSRGTAKDDLFPQATFLPPSGVKNKILSGAYGSNAQTPSAGFSGVAMILAGDGVHQTAAGDFEIAVKEHKVIATDHNGTALPLCNDGMTLPDQFVTKGGYCSAFLTEIKGKQRLITARHCVTGAGRQSFPLSPVVFGLHEEIITADSLSVEADQVYTMVGVEDTASLNLQDRRHDYAVMRLDRQVPEHIAKPLTLDLNSDRVPGDELILVGHPGGLPQKLDFKLAPPPFEPILVGSALEDDLVLRVGTDSYHGDSGAPLISWKSGDVVGILVSGLGDYQKKVNQLDGSICATSQQTVLFKDSQEYAVDVRRLAHLF